MNLRTLILENQNDPPFDIRTATVMRLTTLFIILIAALCVLYVGLTQKSMYIGNIFVAMISASIITAMHLSYLYLIFWLLIFSKPPERLFRQQMLFPFILAFAYIIYAASL